MSIQRFQGKFHPLEQFVERGLIAGEIRPDEVFKNRRRAVLGAPEARHLFQAPLQARLNSGAVLRYQLPFDFLDRFPHPWLLSCGRRFPAGLAGLSRQD